MGCWLLNPKIGEGESIIANYNPVTGKSSKPPKIRKLRPLPAGYRNPRRKRPEGYLSKLKEYFKVGDIIVFRNGDRATVIETWEKRNRVMMYQEVDCFLPEDAPSDDDVPTIAGPKYQAVKIEHADGRIEDWRGSELARKAKKVRGKK